MTGYDIGVTAGVCDRTRAQTRCGGLWNALSGPDWVRPAQGLLAGEAWRVMRMVGASAAGVSRVVVVLDHALSHGGRQGA